MDLKTALPTAAQKAKIEQLTTDLDNAQYKFEDESSRTFTRYYNDVRAQAAGQAFGSWVTKNAPSYGNAKRQMQDANTALQNYQVSVYGPQARQLGLQRDRILLQALEEVYPEPGYVIPQS